ATRPRHQRESTHHRRHPRSGTGAHDTTRKGRHPATSSAPPPRGLLLRPHPKSSRETSWCRIGSGMWESVALTLAGAAGNSIGKVLQKKGTHILPPLSFKLKVIRGYALNRLWISGFLLDMCGAALMLTALSQAPVSVVQPIAGCGLAILCVFSHFYLKEVMNGLDWIAITMAGLGTIGVGVGGEEQKVEEIPLFSIPWLVLTVVILFVGSAQHLASYLQKAEARTRVDWT
uniref:Probable magnesium transporter n=2 Tax=Aegilops tauschii subsp. strangulata TaxID=200361 RepID=A0A453F998_AEGTS